MGVAGSREVVVGVHPVAIARVAGDAFGGRENVRRAKDEGQRDKDCRERPRAERSEMRMKLGHLGSSLAVELGACKVAPMRSRSVSCDLGEAGYLRRMLVASEGSLLALS